MPAKLSAEGLWGVRGAGLANGSVLSVGPRRKIRNPQSVLTPTWPMRQATLDLDFANDRGFAYGRGQASIAPHITFTRASSATYFNSTGVLTTAASNAPRFDYDPVTLQPKGLLIEEQRTNLLTHSEQFDNAAWTQTATTVTVNSTTAPDGVMSADKIVESSATSVHSVQQQGVASSASGVAYTLTMYLKAAERGFAFIGLGGAGFVSVPYASVNLNTGAMAVTNGFPTAYSAISSGGGWWRVVITGTTTAVGSVVADIRTSIDGVWANRTYTGDGTSGLYIWGAQLEAGSFGTSYIPTTSAQATRAADVAVISQLVPWFNASEGTLFVEQTFGGGLIGSPAASNVIALNDGTTVNTIVLRTVADLTNPQADARVVTGGVTQMDTAGPQPVAAGTAYKRALAYKANDCAQAYNGVTPASELDTSVTLPAVTTLSIPQVASSATNCMWIKRLAYYPRRLSNAELQGLTA